MVLSKKVAFPNKMVGKPDQLLAPWEIKVLMVSKLSRSNFFIRSQLSVPALR
jgi:hypothetical protein